MNVLYSFVEDCMENGSRKSIETLVEKLHQNPGDHSEYFNIVGNLQYLLKRFINASMSRLANIKFIAYLVLKAILETQAASLPQINIKNLVCFINEASTWKKQNKNKTQCEGYASGRILVFNAFKQILINNEECLDGLQEICLDFPKYQEQAVQLFYFLAKNKSTRTKFKSLPLTTPNSKMLKQILQNNFTKNKKTFTIQQIDEILAECAKQYPKKNILLQYLGSTLESSLQQQTTVAQFFQSKASQFFDQNTEEVQRKQIFYLLVLFQWYVKNTIFGIQNYKNTLSIKMLTVWLEQLRVLNKRLKIQAQSITLKLQPDPQFCKQLLQILHQNGVYLQNVSIKHPLVELYKHVEADNYFDYLSSICIAESASDEYEDQKTKPIAQLQYFVRLRLNDVSLNKLSETLLILLNNYFGSKSEANINLVWSFTNNIWPIVSKKKLQINKLALNIMKTINLEQLKIQEEVKKLMKKQLISLKKRIKQLSETSNKTIIMFLNFNIIVLMYSLVYHQELEVCAQLSILHQDLLNLINNQSNGASKKKIKLSKTQVHDPKKPIHVLVDIFISLMTKAPNFLRNSINSLFEELIPQLQQSDLEHLLEVIAKPDLEYIQQL